MDHRAEIRDFLRTRRAKISPEQANLYAYGGHRRVPGLRREEVAMIAGVSVDYYARLERGNLSGVSDEVLGSIARALQLDEAESAHLFDLARAARATTSPRRRAAAAQHVRPSVQRLLDSWNGVPAWVRNERMDILGTNELGRALYSEVFADPVRPANNARFVFLDQRSHDFYPEWEQGANDIVAILRSYAGRNPGDRSLMELIGELSTRSEPFRTKWANHNVRFHRTGVKRLHHPVVGDLELAYEAHGAARRPRAHDVRLHGRARLTERGAAQAARELGGHGCRGCRCGGGRVGRRGGPSRRGADPPQVVATASSEPDHRPRQRRRQPERREHVVVEARHRADPAAREGEHDQADAEAGAGRRAEVGAERRLPVGARRHEVEPPARVEDALAEPGDEVSSLVLERHRRHRGEHVVGEQGHQRSDIRRLPCADESRHDRVLGSGVRGGRRRVLLGRPSPVAQVRARPLQRAVDGRDGRVEQVGHLGGTESEDIAQDEDGQLAGRQHLQGGHERQRDRLGLLDARLGPDVPSAPSKRASGSGSSQVTSPSPLGSGGSTFGTFHAEAGRRAADRRALRHRLVAMR